MKEYKITKIGEWEVLEGELSIQHGEETHQFQSKVFHVLMILADNHGKTKSRDSLIEEVWDNNVNVGQRGLTNAIWQLRKCLQEDDSELEAIKTVSKIGYQLTLPVKKISETKPQKNQPLSTGILVKVFLILTITLLSLLATQYFYAPESDSDKNLAREFSAITYFEGIEEFPDVSSDGTKLAFVREMPNTNSQLFVKSLTDLDSPIRQTTYRDIAETLPVWGNDDKEIAFLRLNNIGQCELLIKKIDDLSERFIDNCYHKRFHKTMDWSKNSQWLAYTKPAQSTNEPAVFVHNTLTQKTRQFSFPNSTSSDLQLSWAKASNRLAFVRNQDTTSSIYLKSIDGKEELLVKFNNPVNGLTWYNDDKYLVVNLLKNGNYELWKINISDGKGEFLHRDDVNQNPASIPGSKDIVYTKHVAKEFLEIHGFTEKTKSSKIRSSRRELYGQYSTDNGLVIFLSNRSGRFETWVAEKDGTKIRQLTKDSAITGVPVWGEKDVFAVVRAEKGKKTKDIYDSNLNESELTNITNDNFDYRNLVWVQDSLFLVNTNRSGHWELWTVDIESKSFEQLTNGGAMIGQLSSDRKHLYYTKENINGIWKMRLSTGIEELVSNKLSLDDWGSWGLIDNQLVYLRRGKNEDFVESMDLVNKEISILNRFIKSQIKINRGLRVNKNGYVVSLLGHKESDLYRLSLQ